MKLVGPRPYADPDAAGKRLIEIANGVEAIDGRIHIERINLLMLRDGASPAKYRAGLQHAVEKGWLTYHESGTYVTFTASGAILFT